MSRKVFDTLASAVGLVVRTLTSWISPKSLGSSAPSGT